MFIDLDGGQIDGRREEVSTAVLGDERADAVAAVVGTTLIAGAAIYENWDTIKKLPGKAVDGVKAAAGWAGDKAGAAAGWVGGKASGAWEGAKDLLSGW